ncbi:hypothetical protein ARTHRO8AJ_160092 [Arthrobacter sp. 8AJ]|nr:hypothetical protein ARTHRO8AJ_160092 [Arthrobacter sp. 8AJ]
MRRAAGSPPSKARTDRSGGTRWPPTRSCTQRCCTASTRTWMTCCNCHGLAPSNEYCDTGHLQTGVSGVAYSILRNKALNNCRGFNPGRPMSYAFMQVTSASAKPRFAGRQPSIRGGVPRVTTRPVRSGCGKRGFPVPESCIQVRSL